MQSGFLLVTAIFLLVILAALGAFILTISGTQQTSSALDVQGSRAYQAARAGIEWASYQVLISPAVQVDPTSSGSTTGTSVDVSHTVSGINRLMLVGISATTAVSALTVNSVVWDPGGAGQLTLTQVCTAIHSSNDAKMWIFQGLAPATGTKTLRVTFGAGTQPKVVGVMSFTNVDQTTPLGASSTNTGNSNSATVNVTSAGGELVFDTVAVEDAASITVAAGQTQRWNVKLGSTNGAGSTEPGAASVTMSWSSPTAEKWAMCGVPIKPVSGSSFATACTPGPTTQNVTGMGGTLSGFTAAVTCSSTTYTEGGATVTVYQIISTGAQGTVGTLDRVERQLQVTLSK